MGAPPYDPRCHLAVLYGQLRRRFNARPAGPALERDFRFIAAILQAKIRRAHAPLLLKSLRRQPCGPDKERPVIPHLFLPAVCGAGEGRIQCFDRNDEMMDSVRVLRIRDQVILSCLGGFLAGARVKVQVSGASHRHVSYHCAVLYGKQAVLDSEHGGAGIDRHLPGTVSKLFRPDQPKEKMPLIIISHGFGSSYHAGVPYAEAFTKQGYMVYCFDFCGGGNRSKSDGKTNEMSIVTEREELKAILAQLKQRSDVDKSNITLMGESQGGIVTALAAVDVEKDIRNIVLFYPAFSIPVDTHKRYPSKADIPEEGEIWGMKLGKCYAEDIYDLNPYDVIAKFQKPVLIIHGDSDRIVPVGYSDRAAQTYKEVEYYVLHGIDHGYSGISQWLAIQLVQEYLKKH